MREIKFRAWDGIIMFEVEAIQFNGNRNTNIAFVRPRESGEYVEADVMQYTGLKDKNGVDIYEGDVFICDVGDDYPEICRYVVCFEHFSFIAKLSLNKTSGWEHLLEFESWEIEVIGNIYENPELLK